MILSTLVTSQLAIEIVESGD